MEFVVHPIYSAKANAAFWPDFENREQNDVRHEALWGTFMADGYGVEWYFGYACPHSDLTYKDFQSRDLFRDQNRYARRFIEQHLSFWNMNPANELTDDVHSYCLAEKGSIYTVYLPMKLPTVSLDLNHVQGTFEVNIDTLSINQLK